MARFIKNNLVNILVIVVIAILVFGLSYSFFKSKPTKANIGQIKILPTGYTIYFEGLSSDEPGWHNPGAALIQDLGKDASFEEFNKENSAFPMEIEEEQSSPSEPAQNLESIEAGPPTCETCGGEETPSPSEEINDISTESETIEEILTSPSETSLRDRREIPFVLVIIKNLTRASADLFGIGNLAASESAPDEDAQSVVPLVDISTPQASESGVVEGVSTESEGSPIYVPLVPLDELEEMVSLSEQLATESGEGVNPDETILGPIASESEEIISVSEEPVIDFAPGFIERPLEFFDFNVPEDFASNSDGKQIKNAQLRLSMAVEGGGPQDSLIIEYNVGGETSYMDWQLLAELFLSDQNSNATNGGYWLYGLPIFENWEDLNKLKVRFKYRGILPDPMAEMSETNKPKGQVYLDALWLEVEYEEPLEEKEKIKEEKIDAEIQVISRKDFKLGEEPKLVFKYQRKQQRNLLNKVFEGVADIFRDEYKDIKINAKLIGPDGREVEGPESGEGFGYQIKYEKDGEFKVDISKPRFDYYFRPGKYTLQFEINDGEKVFVENQDFTWGVLAINVNKSIYLKGEQAYLQMAVLTDSGHTICDANLQLEIKGPEESSGLFGLKKTQKIITLSTLDGSIQYSGKCGANNVTDIPDYFAYYEIPDKTGIYEMKLTNFDNGYEITDYFEVQESVAFEIERTGPTRIYPPATYEMKIKIKANQDFQGEIVEIVPMTFIIKENLGAKKESLMDNYTKTIIWQAEIKKGETKEFSYTFDAPDVSPYLYLLGPLKMFDPSTGSGRSVFEEVRSWQIASDVTCGAAGFTDPLSNGVCVGYLTTTGAQQWAIPWDWSNTNMIEVMGGGGGGSGNTPLANANGAGAGGGGAYASVSNTAGLSQNIDYYVGAGGGGGSSADGTEGETTWFGNAASASSIVCANGGAPGTTYFSGAGGTKCNGIGGAGYSGGNGGNGGGAGEGGGGGGGGAAGPDGIGQAGGDGGGDGGGGGGGAGGGLSTAGATATSDTGGLGGKGPLGLAGDQGAAGGGAGSDGGGGGGATDGSGDESGGPGGTGQDWQVASPSYGAGGGGGGGSSDGNGDNGGLYGGGGGGAAEDGTVGGNGRNGLIVITYTHADFVVSGICKQYNQNDNSTETGIIKVAVNTTINGTTASCSAGAWTLTLSSPPVVGDVITVWADGVNVENRAVAVTAYDGSGSTIASIPLYEHHLSIGSNDNIIASNSDLAIYDNSISTDADIFFDVDSSSNLVACINSGCENSELYIAFGNKYAPGSASARYEEIHDIEIDGTFDMTGTNNYASVSGGWNNDATFTPATSTIFFTATASAEIVSASADATYAFNNVQFGDNATTGYTGQWNLSSALDVNGNMTIDGGTLNPGNSNTNLAGNLLLSANGNYTKGNGTFTFDGSGTSTWTDSRTTKADMGQVSINGTTKTIQLGSSVKANELTVAAGQTLDIYAWDYDLIISGDGQGANRPLQVLGTVDFGIWFPEIQYIASQSTDIEDMDYGTLTLASSSANSNFYIYNSTAEIIVSRSFSITAGTFYGDDDTIRFRGPSGAPGFTAVSGIFMPQTSTVSYEIDANTNIASMSDGGNTGYYNLAVGDNTSLTAARRYTFDGNSDVSVSHDLTVGASGGSYIHIFDLYSSTLNLTGANDPLTIRSKGYFEPYSAGSDGTATVRYTSNAATTINATAHYYILEVGDSNGANVSYTADGNITVNKQLDLQSAADTYLNTFNLGAYDLAVGSASFTNSGGISAPTRSTITQAPSGTTAVRSSASGSATIGGAGTTTLYNFTVGVASESVGYTFTLAGEVGVSSSFTIEGGHTATHSLAFSSNELSIWGNFDLSGAGASLSSQTGTAYFNGTGNTTFTDAAGENNSEFYNLTINKTNAGNVTLSNDLTARNTLTITDGTLVQGNQNIRIEGTSAVSVIAGAEWSAIGTGDLTLGGTFINAGTVEFDTNNQDCTNVSDDIQILSTSGGSQRAWSGGGTFTMYNLYVQDQGGSVTCYSCTNVSNNSWTFSDCAVNNPPTIGEVNVWGTGVTTITLIEDSAIDIMASAYITDAQGCTDIRDGGGVEAIFYSADKYWTPGQTGTCSLDYNNCIDNSVTSCSYQSCSGNIATYECFASSSLWYYANATTGSTASVSGGWEVAVWASDSYWEDAASSSCDDFAPTASNQAEVQILEAVAMESASQSVAYSNTLPNTDSTIAERGARNSGNRGINVLISESGADPLLANPYSQIFASGSFTWPWNSDAYGVSLSASSKELELDLSYRGSGDSLASPSEADDQIFWGLHVPLGTLPGNYSGQSTYTSTAD